MRTYTYITPILLIAVTLLFTQCMEQRMGCVDKNAVNYDVTADVDDGSCYYDKNIEPVNCQSDYSGNLLINNKTSNNLYLYNNGEWITCISAYDTSFLVTIPNPDLDVVNLQILKASDVSDQTYPDFSYVYREWNIALSDNTNENERANWLISGTDEYTGTATMLLNYPSVDEYNQENIYQVDIYLNSQSGAKLASLKPGASNKKVNVNYGVHMLYFNYWYSDPDSPTDNYLELGWQQEKDIVLNAEHSEVSISIPSFDSDQGKYGYLHVENNYDSPISIYANGTLIENIVKTTEVTDALSIIPKYNSTDFLIPVDDNYTIVAKSIDGAKTFGTYLNINVLIDNSTSLKFGELLTSISITNNTSNNLGVFTLDEEFIGLIANADGVLEKCYVSSDYDSILLMDFAKTLKKTVAVQSSITIDSLESYFVNKLVIDEPWLKYGNEYRSDTAMSHGESSVMKGTLFITNPTVLYFEYNVSSEANFDEFSFSINNTHVLSEISGETGWIQYAKSFDPGEYKLQWRYSKDYEVSQGLDRVRIKDLRIEF